MNKNIINTYQGPDRKWTLHQGDVQQVLPPLAPNSFAGALCDPPYGINFMEKGWDRAVPPVSVWKHVLRLCKPGAYLLAFGGTKTFHRLTCNIEDAGWQIRDTCCWLYGEGFPKRHDISKAIDDHLGAERPVVGGKSKPASDEAQSWDGYSTALKPAWEPIVLAQKPRRGTFAGNALRFGCGGLNIDGCRIGSSGGTRRSHQEPYPRRSDGSEDRTHWARTGHDIEQISQGRWPANLLLDERAAELLDGQSGVSRSRRSRRRKAGRKGNGTTLNDFPFCHDNMGGYSDKGGASRFFYVAKASRKERDGLNHPTMKPLALCDYLAKLILPPESQMPRRLLVPFSGVASEMIGALSAGWDHVTGIEREDGYVTASRSRLSKGWTPAKPTVNERRRM